MITENQLTKQEIFHYALPELVLCMIDSTVNSSNIHLNGDQNMELLNDKYSGRGVWNSLLFH